MRSSKIDPYKIEWNKFWKNPEIDDIKKILYRMEFEIAQECAISGEKEALKQFFLPKSKFFPKITNNLDTLIKSDYFKSKFNLEGFKNKFKIGLYFNSYFYKHLLFFVITIPLFLLLDLLFGFRVIFRFFFSEKNELILMLLFLYIVGITYLYLIYFSSVTYFKDKILFKIRIFTKITQNLILIIYMVSLLTYIVINADKSLRDINVALDFAQHVFGGFLDLVIFTGITGIQMYLIEKQKLFLYNAIKLINAMKYKFEIIRSKIFFYFYHFVEQFDDKLNKSLILKVNNKEEIENSFYSTMFTDEIDVLYQIGIGLEKFFLDEVKSRNFTKLNYSEANYLINLLNNTFKNIKLPLLSFRKFSIIDFILDKYKPILSIIVAISSFIGSTVIIF